MIVLRTVKLYTSCKNFEQTLFKQIVTRDEVLALVHLFLLDLHRVDELKNFATDNPLSW